MELYFAKIKTYKVVGISIPLLIYSWMVLSNTEGENLNYVILSLAFGLICAILPFLIFTRLAPKAMIIFNVISFARISYSDIKFVSFGKYEAKGISVPSIQIVYQRKSIVRFGHIFYQHYNKSDLVELLENLKLKNGDILGVEGIQREILKG